MDYLNFIFNQGFKFWSHLILLLIVFSIVLFILILKFFNLYSIKTKSIMSLILSLIIVIVVSAIGFSSYNRLQTKRNNTKELMYSLSLQHIDEKIVKLLDIKDTSK